MLLWCTNLKHAHGILNTKAKEPQVTDPCFKSSLIFSCFLINTADRIIRVYDGREILTCGKDGEPEPMQKLQDLVNRYSAPYLYILY